MNDDPIVADASAILAALKHEPFGEFDPQRMIKALISTVNLCEVMTKLIDGGLTEAQVDAALAALDLRVHSFDRHQARAAASLRATTRQAGLSLGARACLALGKQLDCAVVTADRAWANLDIGANVVLIR